MKKKITLILFFFIQIATGQSQVDKLSISFVNNTKIEVFKQIENISDYQFYYVKSWIDSTLISGNYSKVSIKFILDDIFKNTVINYYISNDKKIILSQNSIIYDSLPTDFFVLDESISNQEQNSQPILVEKNTGKVKTEIETIRIGIENKFFLEDKFVMSGFVFNKVTNNPVENLVILNKQYNINAISDKNGYYSIALPPGINYIEFKSIEIKDVTKRIIIYGDGKINFSLDENPEILDEVVIEADRDNNVANAITGITHIQVEKVKTVPLVLGERDILRIATTLPGITTAGEGSGGYNVRGGKADQNLMLLDNAVIYNPTHFFGIFSAINSYTTGSFEIYKGSIPAEFGGRLSSVFNITTKNANNQKFSGEGAIGPVTSNLTLEIPIIKEKSSLLVSGRGTYSDWILKSLDEESLKNSEASFYDFIVKYNHVINENNSIGATAYYSKDNFSITSDSLYSYSNNLINLNWRFKINDKNRGALSLSNSGYEYNIQFDGNSNNDFDLGYRINETELKLKMNYNLNEQHSFSYGLSSKLYNNEPGFIDPINESIVKPIDIPEERALESAVYFSDDYKITDKLLLSAGIRYSLYAFLGNTSQKIYQEGLPINEGTVIDTVDYSKNEVAQAYNGPEIRISSRYLISSDFSIKASYNNTYQFIHTLSNNTTESPTDTYKLSDLYIKPQRANQFSLGFYKNLNGNKYELSLEGYYKKSKNILDYKVGADLLLNESIETEVFQGDGKAYGIEFLARKNDGNLNGWIGYSYSRSFIKLDSEFNEETVNNGDYFPTNYDKPHDFSLVANYKFTKRYSFSANFIYQTGRPVTYPLGSYKLHGSEYVQYSDRNQYRIPDYYRLDVGINIEGNHKIKKLAHSFWNISVYNILGRNNPYSLYFVTENGEVKAYQTSIFSMPIPTITYNFKF
jgi:hypothetical protein